MRLPPAPGRFPLVTIRMFGGCRQFLRSALATGAAVACLATAAAVAQEASSTAADWKTPRTAWGAPDVQGVWDYRTLTPLQRPAELAGRTTLTSAEAAVYEARENALRADYDHSPSVHAKWWLDYGRELTADRRTALIVDPPDGRIPPATDAARERRAVREARRRRGPADGADARRLGERCITFGLPRFPGAYNNHFLIAQTPTHAAIVAEMIHDVRLVALDGRQPPPGVVLQWHGASRGRYDGDSLVVETTQFSPRSAFWGSTAQLRLVERFTRVGPDTVEYAVTLADPATWTRPWTAVVPLKRTDQTLYEYACHEGNYGLRNILRNARLAELVGDSGRPAP